MEKSFINILSTGGGKFFPIISIEKVVATGRCSVMKGFLSFPSRNFVTIFSKSVSKEIITVMLLEM